ncbi:MAG TPA: A/G-specific adenine glycosylase [Candidatus Acidoferrales bacterium]|nr:A/G-specific adenine glycosylase [Candidatus Acidoferrales bacterium]
MSTQASEKIRADLHRRLLTWFRRHRRNLPWRDRRDPYRIWVAEIMLQQTRVAAVLPHYNRFLERFPTVESVAAARQQEVLRLWSGLGYYRRAQNFHRAAQEIVASHGGRFPRTLKAALALPGIGRYTAAAVLSIAYDVPLAALDGNVARVLARLGAVRGDLRAALRWRQLGKTAEHLLAQQAPGNWNQALMELGEVICTPQTPRCGDCPLLRFCLAQARGLTEQIPAPRRKRASVSLRIAAAILRDSSRRTLLVRDPTARGSALFSRLWQFPAVEVTREPLVELEGHLRRTLKLDSAPLKLEALPAARHGVTFRNITLLPFLARVAELPRLPRTRILAFDHIDRLPISSATRKIAAAAEQT